MLWSCLECLTRYALDLQACPHCGSNRREEDGMPKITVHGGASDARDDVQPVEYAPGVSDNVVVEAIEGSEPSSPGTSSSASTRKTASTSRKSAPAPRRRALTTESLSSQGPEESCIALLGTTTGPVTEGSSDANE